MKNKRIQILWRYGLIIVAISLVALAIVWSAVDTTLINADKWNTKTDSLLRRVYLVPPKRGDILASDGSVLATNLTAYTIAIDYRANSKEQEAFTAALDSLSDSMALYYPQRTAKEWKERLGRPLEKPESKRTQFHVLLRDVTYNDYLRIRNFPFFHNYKKKYKHGLVYTTKEIRVMPFGNMARRSIGRCSYIMEPRFDGKNSKYDSIQALHGYSGLESALDSILYGKTGTAKAVQLNQGVSTWVDQPATDGSTVRTTIDINMQDIVENELLDMLQTTEAEWGTCLLMEVATGDIKAISNFERDKKTGQYTEAWNHVLRRYEPGSVMKPISMLVALEDGYAFPLDRQYPIGSTYAYRGGAPIHDTHSPATLPVSRFIEYSSNIGMTRLIAPHYENNLNGFRERLREIGFFDTLYTGMAGEVPPRFPTLNPKTGGHISLSRMSYGYATMIPPLYTCAIYNAIANDGKFVRPRMVKEIIRPDGTVEARPVSYVRDSICSRRNARILRDMIHSVVWGDGGTAKSVRNDLVDIAGKTGTCRVVQEAKRDTAGNIIGNSTSSYIENQYRLAFCGFFPYESPKYTCMVLISRPSPAYKGAATTSGTVVKNIALKMYARGMFDNSSDINKNEGEDRNPLVYASNQNIDKSVHKVTGNTSPRRYKAKEAPQKGVTPDIRGLGMREAIARLEDSGYNICVNGTGYAVTQTPPPGTALKPGETVSVRFTSR